MTVADGGYVSGDGDTPAPLLHAGEYVISPRTLDRARWREILDRLNGGDDE